MDHVAMVSKLCRNTNRKDRQKLVRWFAWCISVTVKCCVRLMTHETFVAGLLLRNFAAQQVAQQSCATKVWCVISLRLIKRFFSWSYYLELLLRTFDSSGLIRLLRLCFWETEPLRFNDLLLRNGSTRYDTECTVPCKVMCSFKRSLNKQEK